MIITGAALALASAAMAADWPQWRGPDRTDRSSETGLLKQWPEGGPKLVWQIDTLGIGHAGPSVVGGRIYIMSDRGNGEELHCLDASNGKMIWSTPVGSHYDNNWGDGPRSTPTIDDGKAYCMGSKGELACIDATSGKSLWTQDLNKLGGKTEGWGYTQSPLVDGDQVVATAGGNGPCYAFNKKTGEIIWKSDNFKDAGHYSSLIAIDHNGKRQYVKLRVESVNGIDAKDGKLLWSVPWHGKTAVIPTPIYHNGHVYITSGYGQGCMLIKIADDSKSAEIVYDNKTMKNHHGGVVRVGEQLYGHNDSAWVCQDFMSGDMIWSSRDLGKGSCTYADGMLYLYSESDGTCVLIEASKDGWKEHGRLNLPAKTNKPRKSGKIWVHPVISDGKLYLRDQDLFFCFDVKQ
ncbi:MAG: PQQ-binding-like beta-propeller repeat protein [Phycisphaera sp.]|nr:PQQ-binding-like beta-propeller repeat protein [Phycisphaera sp.]